LNVLEYISKPDAELQDNKRDMDGGGSWQGHLDSGLDWLEWRALASAHGRSLAWLPMVTSIKLSPSHISHKKLTLFLEIE
jgi:hypothetical protein